MPKTPPDKTPNSFDHRDVDPELVLNLASIHCTIQEIASVLGCSPSTLRRRFGPELSAGRDRGKASLRRRQWELAQQGDRGMLIWLGKQWLGQSDQLKVDWRAELASVLGIDREALPDALEVADSGSLLGSGAEVQDADVSEGDAESRAGRDGDDENPQKSGVFEGDSGAGFAKTGET